MNFKNKSIKSTIDETIEIIKQINIYPLHPTRTLKHIKLKSGSNFEVDYNLRLHSVFYYRIGSKFTFGFEFHFLTAFSLFKSASVCSVCFFFSWAIIHLIPNICSKLITLRINTASSR